LECEKKCQVAYCAFIYEEIDAAINVFLRTEEKLNKKRRHMLSASLKEDKFIGAEFR